MSKLYTVQETAKILRVNKNKVYEYIERKELKATKIGCLKIKEEWINEFIENRMGTVETVPAA
jgi:excisionase family DNA binding protein